MEALGKWPEFEYLSSCGCDVLLNKCGGLTRQHGSARLGTNDVRCSVRLFSLSAPFTWARLGVYTLQHSALSCHEDALQEAHFALGPYSNLKSQIADRASELHGTRSHHGPPNHMPRLEYGFRHPSLRSGSDAHATDNIAHK